MIVTEWQARHGLTAAEHQAEFDRLAARGFRPLRVCGYELAGVRRFASIWAVQGGSAWQARHDLPAGDHRREAAPAPGGRGRERARTLTPPPSAAAGPGRGW
ncbi:hypothetical protein [Kitasatospora herbaricolor]|uniref:Uncharacterized protein n=1 Tax=Kitasatospora herbaricolor TaxID=68217 RepID=A0ABZ1WDL1_9ACTN|nr:hypothetical protein [Kitasatospora herbaricolor]